MTMSNNLRNLRKKAGLTQKQLGARCVPPISEVNISRYETGVHEMKSDVLRRISKALGVTPINIIGFGAEENARDSDKENLYETAAEIAMRHIETLPTGARNKISPKKFAKFVMLIHDALAESPSPTPSAMGATMLSGILIMAQHAEN